MATQCPHTAGCGTATPTDLPQRNNDANWINLIRFYWMP